MVCVRPQIQFPVNERGREKGKARKRERERGEERVREGVRLVDLERHRVLYCKY